MKASFNILDVKFAFILYIIGVPVQYKIWARFGVNYEVQMLFNDIDMYEYYADEGRPEQA